MFQGSFREISRVFKNISRVFQVRLKDISRDIKGLRVFERSLNGVSRGFQGSFVSRKFQESFKGISRKF